VERILALWIVGLTLMNRVFIENGDKEISVEFIGMCWLYLRILC